MNDLITQSIPPTVYYTPGELTSPKFATAFAQGCNGIVRRVGDRLHDGAFAGFCTPASWHLLDEAIRQRREYYYGDHGYWRRGRYYRVAKNAMQYQPTLPAILEARKRRFVQLGMLASPRWRDDGRHVLVCANSDVYHQRFGKSQQEWIDDVVNQLRRATDRPIVVRTKADAKRTHITQALNGAWLTVVFSSNAAVDSLQAGVPIAVTAPFASTYAMGIPDLNRVESPYYPEHRELFLWHLAESQWTLDELASGTAWAWLQEKHG